jgi:hypothetical protein
MAWCLKIVMYERAPQRPVGLFKPTVRCRREFNGSFEPKIPTHAVCTDFHLPFVIIQVGQMHRMLTSSAEPLRWCEYSVNGYDRNVDRKPFAKHVVVCMAIPRSVDCQRFA